MKLFSWVQSKRNAKQASKKPDIAPPYKRETKEEFSDWPQAFLSIGTFGNKDLKQEGKIQSHDKPQKHDLTLEEVRQLHKELNALVSNCKNLDNLAILEAKDNNNGDQEEFNNDQDKHFMSIALNDKGKDVYLDNSNGGIAGAISKKSVSFLLKKMFVCGAGMGPMPSLRDPTLSPPQTRMEKILRKLLQKKIHPQGPSTPISKKRYLENRHESSSNKDGNDHDHKNYHDDDENSDDDRDQGDKGSKWVKTDTEYIVLEI